MAKGTLQFTLVIAFLFLVCYAGITWFRYGAWTATVRFKVSAGHCRSNLSQIAKALTTYAAEGDGRLPDAVNWCDALHLSRILPDPGCFQCPQFARDAWKPYTFSIGGLKLLLGGPPLPPCTYGFNAKLSGAKLKDLPPDVVLVSETHGGWNQHGGAGDVALRHRGHAVVLFADSHVELRPPKELANLRWEP